MSRWTKVAIVCAGYVLAIVAGSVASHLHDARLNAMPYDTSGGMYAAGVFMAGVAAFLVVALVPTLLALWFLRGSTRLWQAIAFASVGFAGAGLVAVLVFLMSRDTSRSPVLMIVNLFGLAQLLGVPLWTIAFALFAAFAPTRHARRLLVTAIGIELVIGVFAAIHWLVPYSRI